MSYKKLVSLLAVSTFALAACGTNDTEEPETDDTEQTDDAEGSSTQDLIEEAKNQSGDAYPEYGMTVTGAWTVDGYEVSYATGEAATIPVSVITSAEEYNVYLLENGVISEVVSNEPEVEFVVDSPAADGDYVVGISGEDLGAAGDEVAVEDFYRYENVILVEAAEEEAPAE